MKIIRDNGLILVLRRTIKYKSMKEKNRTQIFTILGLILIISIIYSLTAMYPNYDSAFDMGFSAGSFFGRALKILGVIGLITYGIRTIKRRGLKTLE